MRDVVIAALVSAVVSLGISYWMTRRAVLPAETAVNQTSETLGAVQGIRAPQKIQISLQVTSAGGGRCKSDTDVKRRAVRGDDVEWIVRRQGPNVSNCFSDGQTVKIVPKPGNTSPLNPAMPFDAHLIRATAKDPMRYLYEVWLADRSGNNLYLMEDPELEIIEVRSTQ